MLLRNRDQLKLVAGIAVRPYRKCEAMGSFGEALKIGAGGVVIIGIITAAGIRSTGLSRLSLAGGTATSRIFRSVERP